MNERDKELAKQAGLKTYQEQAPGLDGMVGSWEAIEAFADLIRADEREACEIAVVQAVKKGFQVAIDMERESCALLCDAHKAKENLFAEERYAAHWLSVAIRARGNK